MTELTNQSEGESQTEDTNGTEGVSADEGKQNEEIQTDTNVKTEAEKQAIKQVAKWRGDIEAGDANISDAPEWIQRKLDKSTSPELDSRLENLVDARLQAQKEADYALELREDLVGLGLSEAETQDLLADADVLIKKGLSEVDALELAMDIAQGRLGEHTRNSKRAAMALTPKGNHRGGGDKSTANWKNLSDAELVKASIAANDSFS